MKNKAEDNQLDSGIRQNDAVVKVMLDKPGAKACGEYLAGQEYEVEVGEARRLVEVKGFSYVDGE